MSVKDKLQIILITYNREKYVEKTFEQLFCDESPIKDYDILVLDNNSTDGTGDYVKEFMQSHPNISYQKNRYNLGISGNIAKAMEIAEKDYVWIIADDDIFDWGNWQEVEQAIANDEGFIMVSRYALSEELKNEAYQQIGQAGFIPACIFNTRLFTNETMRNAFDNIFTLFPHLYPLVEFINEGNKVYVVDKAIVNNGMTYLKGNDYSYTRGINDSKISQRSKTMSWVVGWANITSMIKDPEIRRKTFSHVGGIYGSWDAFYSHMIYFYSDPKDLMQLIDVYMEADAKTKLKLLKNYFIPDLKSVIRKPRLLFNKLGFFTKKRNRNLPKKPSNPL